MIVISDTSCLSNLITLGHEEIIPKLFGEVLTPPAVVQESKRFHPFIPSWIRVESPNDLAFVTRLRQEVDLGEAEAISLARELKADRLLIDESKGRALAIREGIPIMGLVGVLVLARKRNLIPEMKPVLNKLRLEAGFWISDEIMDAALRAVNE